MGKKSGKKKSKPEKALRVLESSAMSSQAPEGQVLGRAENSAPRGGTVSFRIDASRFSSNPFFSLGSVETPAPTPPAGSPPPYDPKARCPKCGWRVVAERYCAPRQRCMGKCEDQGEHLHRICMQCQASWEESPLDRVARELLERCAAGED